jgi:sugar phosphate isomerase/epimerase
MWSQGRFRAGGATEDDMRSFAEKAASLGFPYIEISYIVPPDGVEALLSSNHVSVSSVHSPCPRIKCAGGRRSEALNLASPDEEERSLAVSCARAAADVAARAGARYLVVHLGSIAGDIFAEEKELRRLYDAGEREGQRVELLRRRANERRRKGAPGYLPFARKSLSEIAEYASRNSIAVGLENRYHFHEFPNVEEMHDLLAGYPPEVAGLWLDVGHAEVMDRLGLTPHERWLNELSHRCIGAHIHDVDGLADHRAPGNGTADWEHYAALLPLAAPRVLEINQHAPENQVAGAIPFLCQRGILP